MFFSDVYYLNYLVLISVFVHFIFKGKLNNIVEIPAGGSQPHQPCPQPLREEEAGEKQQGDWQGPRPQPGEKHPAGRSRESAVERCLSQEEASESVSWHAEEVGLHHQLWRLWGQDHQEQVLVGSSSDGGENWSRTPDRMPSTISVPVIQAVRNQTVTEQNTMIWPFL